MTTSGAVADSELSRVITRTWQGQPPGGATTVSGVPPVPPAGRWICAELSTAQRAGVPVPHSSMRTVPPGQPVSRTSTCSPDFASVRSTPT
ncbi:hypothetical protein [Micromonospora sp. NPDC047134]|uniref:hypothetical protein n=1 Tax=Micromonospora sp. NPDC047134 TaxID=3154340 RepID=UPI0033EDC6A5